jgi:hypothetical protein
MSNARTGTVTGVVTADEGVETGLVTATVTSGARPASDIPTVAEFMSAVVAWPAPNETGYVNLHYSMVNQRDNKGPLLKGMGWPFRDVEVFIRKAAWISNSNQYKDVWFCTSLQSHTGKNTRGNPKAVRLRQNAVALKAIWVDVDVKDDPNHYKTIREAWDAICKFRVDAGLPQFSAAVNSGGGLHIYWISKTRLTPDVWQLYADGLKALLLKHGVKCDAGLTTDGARILRTPGTLNHKYTPARKVDLLPLPLRDYDFTDKLAFLTVVAPGTSPGKAAFNPFFDAASAARFVGAQPWLTGEDKLSDGIGPRKQMPPLDPRPIFDGCGFLRQALTNGGKDYDNPLWNLTNLAATFMEDGNKLAHAMSKGHASYTFAETQAQYDRKIAERQSRELGYPSCATIQSNGCKSCATCPHFVKGKSPLNLGTPSAAQHPDNATEAASGPTVSPPPDLKFSLSDIPPHRPWLYGVDLLRGDLSVLASTGGAGKTSLAMGMAISLASGNSLLGEKIWESGPLKSLYINAEDSGIEMRRRALAFCQQHNITVLDRLYIAGTDDLRVRGLSFLSPAGQNSSVLDQAGFAHLNNLLASLLPDLVVIDPLIALCGGGNVNDNAAMALVMREIKRLAIKFNCSLLIVHHTRKGGEPGSAEAISGASAIKDLARCARMPVTMTTAEMGVFHVLPSERLQYFKLVDAKSNLALHSDETWYKLESQELPNAGAPYPHGDRVQAVVRVQLSVQPGGSANADDMKIEAAILDLVDRGKEIDGQAYPYSPSLAGATNERAILQDAMTAVADATAPRQWALVDLEAVTKNAIKKMKADGRLAVEDMKDLIPKPGRFRRASGLRAVPV